MSVSLSLLKRRSSTSSPPDSSASERKKPRITTITRTRTFAIPTVPPLHSLYPGTSPTPNSRFLSSTPSPAFRRPRPALPSATRSTSPFSIPFPLPPLPTSSPLPLALPAPPQTRTDLDLQTPRTIIARPARPRDSHASIEDRPLTEGDPESPSSRPRGERKRSPISRSLLEIDQSDDIQRGKPVSAVVVEKDQRYEEFLAAKGKIDDSAHQVHRDFYNLFDNVFVQTRIATTMPYPPQIDLDGPVARATGLVFEPSPPAEVAERDAFIERLRKLEDSHSDFSLFDEVWVGVVGERSYSLVDLVAFEAANAEFSRSKEICTSGSLEKLRESVAQCDALRMDYKKERARWNRVVRMREARVVSIEHLRRVSDEMNELAKL